jgi:hypothetical protein
VAFNKVIAGRLADEVLARWRAAATYTDLAQMEAEGDKRLTQLVAEDGRRYNVVEYTLSDGFDGSIRMVVAVDDGGWSALGPLVRDEIMRPDGSFID